MSSSSKISKVSSSSPCNIPYIPDDLLLNYLAHVSRLYYPTLSLVSKRFRSLLTSLELYETRTRLGCTESCLYLCVLDGKIYVVEGLKEFHSSNLIIECFNPKTRKWEDVVGKLYLYGDKNVVYNPKENRWDAVGWMSFSNRYSHFSCVIDNVVYHSFDGWSGMIMWYDSEERFGRRLKGLEKLPTSNGRCFKLVNNGGKIAFIWGKDGCSNEKMIWCAEISLERHSKKEIYGNIDWCNVVLTVPKKSYFKQIISATV